MANEAVLSPPKRTKKAKPKPRPVDDQEPLANKSQLSSSFNEELQQAYIESTQNDGKKKKKVKTNKAALLESLKKGDSIRKDSDESLLLANTYDPDEDPKKKKSNKQRQKENENKLNGVDNQAYKEENEVQPKKPRQKTPKITEDLNKTMTIEELATPKVRKKKPNIDQEAESTVTTPKSPKPKSVESPQKAKSPGSSKTPEPETPSGRNRKPRTDTSPDPGTPVSPGGRSKKSRDETPEPEQAPPSGRKKKKKKNVEDENEEVVSDDPSKVTPDPDEGGQKVKKKKKKKRESAENTPRVIEDQGRVLSLCIHRTDKLKTDFLIAHPLVRVSVIDMSTGKYLKKQRQDRRVTSYYEHDNVDFVLPMMTQPFDFKQNKSTLPVWEEMLLFNENFDYFIQDDPKVIVFFEILDFMSMNATSQHQSIGQESGWHRIAWGFLKLLGANGQPNTDRKTRLQLYQPPVRIRNNAADNSKHELFLWYESYMRNPHSRFTYPSTLYITVKGIIPPDTVNPAPRSMFATQEEKGRITYDDMQKTLDGTSTHRDGKGRSPSLWQRLAGQLCKIPNILAMSLPAGKKGCYVVRFSLDGKYLACGCHDRDGYPIIIYEVSSGKARGQLNGHYSIIYDLCWARSHTELLTASADGTARVWDIDKMSNTAVKTLPHPSYVYTAKYHIRVNKIVVTGGYDRMIRIWTLMGDDAHGTLLQELDSHIGYVNSMCFDAEGLRLFSGDSLGMIKVWSVHVTDKPSSNGFLSNWVKEKDIDEQEFKGVAINVLKMHSSNRRLLVHTRDHKLRLYDLRVGAIMQRFHGALNFREHIRSVMTPCGSFVFAGSEDSCAYVWNIDSGDQVASYQELGYRKPVSDVDYHPHDHMVAFCSFGESHQVVIYKYDHKVAQRDVGLQAAADVLPLQKTGRPQSPEMKPGFEHKLDDDLLETSQSKSGRIDFDLSHSAKMERARKKLDSVLALQSGSMGHPLGVPPGNTGTLGADTWGSTFDSTGMYTNRQSKVFATHKTPEPSAFSPHASRDLMSSSIQQQQFAAHTANMQHGSTWRPGFTAVGRHGNIAPISKPPIYITTSQGKPTLQFHGRKHTKDWVVALYDYQAQRSDELTFARGDDLWVICKDTDIWWLARNSTGEEGYIPANYVTSQGEDKDELNEYSQMITQKDGDDDDDNPRKSRTTAVLSKSGELKFISATEDSDGESSARRKKKLHKRRDSRSGSMDRLSQRSRDTVIQIDSETESVTHSRVHRRKPKTQESAA